MAKYVSDEEALIFLLKMKLILWIPSLFLSSEFQLLCLSYFINSLVTVSSWYSWERA